MNDEEIDSDKEEKINNKRRNEINNNFCFISNEYDDLKDNHRKKCMIL